MLVAIHDRLDGVGAGAWLIPILALCAGIGVLAGVSPTYGVAAAFGLGFVAIVLGNAVTGVVIFTFLSFLEVFNTGGASTSFMKIVGLLLFGSWVAAAATDRRRSTRSLFATSPVLAWGGIALVAWSAISIAWAQNVSAAFTDTYRYGLNVLLIPIMFGTARRREHVIWITVAFVLGAVLSAMYGFLFVPSATAFDAGRSTGTIGDANEQAGVLVAAIALEVALVGIARHRPLLRALASIAVAISIGGVVYTLSRSGLVALGAMMVAGVVIGGRWRRGIAVLLVISLAAVGVYFGVIAPLSARQRVVSSDTSGRSTIWTIAWREVKAHPLLGVGAGNFAYTSIHYLNTPGTITRADLIVDTPKVAHNIYLELLADEGVPGLLALLAVLGGAFVIVLRAAAIFRLRNEVELELIARSVALALVGFMVSDFFLSGQFSKQLWLLIAMCPTLLALARRTPDAAAEARTLARRAAGPPPTVLAGSAA